MTKKELQQIKSMIEEFYSEVMNEPYHCDSIVEDVEHLINYNKNFSRRSEEMRLFKENKNAVISEEVNKILERDIEEMTIEVVISKIAHLSLKEISNYIGDNDD